MFVFKIKWTMYMYHDILFINKHCLAIYICALDIPPPELRKHTGERGLWSWCLKPLLTMFQFYSVYSHFLKYFSFIIGGGNRSFGENYRLFASPLQTLYWEHLSWAGFQLTTVIGIGTDCIVSCKSNYHSITTAPNYVIQFQ